MDKSDGTYKAHVFVCTNAKKSTRCSERGGEELRKALKDWTKENPEWKKRIRINSSGCLDRCKEGIAIVIYPQSRWILDAGLKDLDKIKKEIESIMAED